MKQGLDIHHYKEKLKSGLKCLEEDTISKKNKELINDFVRKGLLRGLSEARVLKYIEILRIVARTIEKDFDKADKQDIEKFVGNLQARGDITSWTKYSYKVILKRFYKWYKGNDENYPDEVKWIKCRLKRSEMKLPEEGDLLTEAEVQKLITVAEHPRDKALISLLYESGCRIGEVATLQLKNVSFDEYGTLIVVQGKTGSRKLRLVSSTPYLATWIQNHPFKDDKQAPLWINIGIKHHHKTLEYDAMRMQIKKIFEKAKINKRANPHSFRHARASFMANHLTEFQMNQYFGWIQGSNMPAVYVHLSGKETESAILELNGFPGQKEKKESLLKPKKCPRCDVINSSESSFCLKCGAILDIQTAIKLEESRKEEKEMRNQSDDVMNQLLKDPEILSLIQKKLLSLNAKQ